MSAIQQMMVSGGLYGTTLISALTTASLTTNLKLCLDAGDSASYDPAIQTDKWLDRSGAGYDFFRGSGTGSDAEDPTFNGSGGSIASLWSFDGGDYFTYDTTNEAWMETLHKNGAVFSAVFFYVAPTTTSFLLSDGGIAASTGIGIHHTGSKTRFDVVNAGVSSFAVIGDTTITSLSPHMVGISINENGGAAGGFLYLDGSYNKVSAADTWNPNYTSPSAASSSYVMQLCANGIGSNRMGSNGKLYCLAVWQGTALTKANMDTIWTAMRGRFGI